MKNTLWLFVVGIISWSLFLIANNMTPGPGVTSGNGNPAILMMIPLILLFAILVFLWGRILKPYANSSSLILIALFTIVIHWIIAIYFQLGEFNRYKQLLADTYQKDIGFVDWQYIDSITSSFLSIYVNNQIFNLNTFFMFLTLSLFVALFMKGMVQSNRLRALLFNKLHFLQLPELDLPNEIIASFEQLYDQYVSPGNGNLIPYGSKVPKYMFLNYLIEEKNILVHGSNIPNIVTFEPKEQTLFNGIKVKAVFAASDGIWPMFFALINRSKYGGSLRNVCLTVKSNKGIKRYYYFSLNNDFDDELWDQGMLYLFHKEKFKQGGIKDEWICKEPVKPLAKITVNPSDFIFKDTISFHHESDPHMKKMIKDLVKRREGTTK
ncbi:hypothetical protein ACFSTA_01470 [Ornithinibacillus salinisoli]|uniref:Uncharacterized protein n=1 Tax=Ornithinibacillus salinisoli TaxID=1848459 RepID=A0ABW4VXE0_9BACI